MVKGLFNFGNTCYFNAALQCLLQVPQLSNRLLLEDYCGDCEFTHEYQHVVRQMWHGDKRPDHTKLLGMFRDRYTQFRGPHQQDSQEAFLCLLDILEKSLSKFIKSVMYTKVLHETVCPSETTTKYEDTPVTILHSDTSQRLEDILKLQHKWNILSGYEDSNGNVHNVATTRSMYYEPGRIMVFTIRMYGEKVGVTAPETLDMFPFLHEKSPHRFESRYELFALCTHHGSAQGGHYVAYTKHKGQWYLKDDQMSTKVDTFPQTGYHYILLYKRVNSFH